MVKKILFLALFAVVAGACSIQRNGNYQSIISGIPWYTENGDNVSAHGANIIKEGDIVPVKVIKVDERDRISFSIKEADKDFFKPKNIEK